MPYCSRCGVEVDRFVESCPLCDAPIQKLSMDDGSLWPGEEAPVKAPPAMSHSEKLSLAKIITTLGFLIPAAIVLTVNWFVSRKITWSLYPLVSLGAAWMWVLISLIFSRRPYMMVTACTLVAVALVWGLGLLAGQVFWILTMGMPLAIMTGLLAALIVLLARNTKRVGGNLAGWILIALALLAVATDLMVGFLTRGNLRPGWSIIAAATAVSVAMLLLYLHYRPSRRALFRRFFHA